MDRILTHTLSDKPPQSGLLSQMNGPLMSTTETEREAGTDLRAMLADKKLLHLKAMGRFNLAVMGKSGVGKSTLINAVFGRKVAETGIGSPVTPGRRLYRTDCGTLGLFDTRGLEVGPDSSRIITELRELLVRAQGKPVSEQIHAVWYCVSGTGGRLEHAEATFIKDVADLGLPVFLVLTRVERDDDGYDPDAVELARYI